MDTEENQTLTSNSVKQNNDGIQLQSSQNSSEVEPPAEQKTGVECYRWFVLAMYIGLNATIAISQNGFAPITTYTADAFGIDTSKVELIGLSYLIMFTPTEILYTFAYKRLPMSWVLKQSALFQLIGTWVRMLAVSRNSFTWVIIGNFIVAWTNAPVQMATIKVSERWFGPSERTIAVSGQSLAFVIGGIAGFIVGPLFVRKGATTDDVFQFMFWQSILVTIFSLPTLFFFKEQPKLPTSLAQDNQPKISTKQDLSILCKNKNFHLLLWNFTMSTVIYDLIAILVDPLTEGYYEGFEIVAFALMFVVGGVVGLIVVTSILDRKKKYLLVQRVWSWSSVIIMILATLTLKTGIFPLFLSLIGFAGFFIIPTTASALAFAGETTYPVESSMVNGLISLAGHTAAAVFGLFASWLVDESQEATLWFFVLLTFIGGILSLFMTEDLKRSQAEKANADFLAESQMTIKQSIVTGVVEQDSQVKENINKTVEETDANSQSQTLL